MSSLRCQCCHRYAPKGLASGEPVGECRGHAAIEEARKWALVWKARALEAGWGKKMDAGEALEALGEALEESGTKVTIKQEAKKLTNDEILHAKWIEEGKDLVYCQGPRRHFFIVGSPMWDQLVASGCFHCGAFPE